jgi:hypothetical protein
MMVLENFTTSLIAQTSLQRDRNLPDFQESIKRGQTTQNKYSAQSCVKGSDCQTNPVLDSRNCAYSLPVERSPIHTRIGAQENTTVSYGGCRFITGYMGAYSCSCTDARQCHKSNGSQVLTLTPRCFSYHDRHVPIITNMIDKGRVTV